MMDVAEVTVTDETAGVDIFPNGIVCPLDPQDGLTCEACQ